MDLLLSGKDRYSIGYINLITYFTDNSYIYRETIIQTNILITQF